MGCGKNYTFDKNFSVTLYFEYENMFNGQDNLDIFKGYDRVNLSYLRIVMENMNFSVKFIEWILLLHCGAQTHLLLSYLSDPIAVLFSVRQGDPIAMILFIIYIEPFLLQVEKVTSGYCLRAPILGTGSMSEQIATKENQESFVLFLID